MTDANTHPKMASNADAMTAVSQLPPAIGSQPMAAIDAFRQDARVRQDPPSPRTGHPYLESMIFMREHSSMYKAPFDSPKRQLNREAAFNSLRGI